MHCGLFADYFWLQQQPPATSQPRSHMGPIAIHVDVANHAAAIPGTGDDRVAFTWTFDVARFVARLLDMEDWEGRFAWPCFGEKATLNEVVKLAEEATGECPTEFWSMLTVAHSQVFTC